MHQFIAKHVKYANLETTEWVKLKFGGSREAHASNLFKNALRYRQYVRRVLWRQMPLRPMWRFLYMYIWKRGFLDGAAGWRLAWLLTSYEYIITLLYQEKVLAEQRRRSVRRTVADQDGTMISVTEETNMPARPASPVTGPLRILHLTGASDAGGLSRYIFDLSMAMHAQGHQVTVAGERGAWHWLFDSAPFPWIEVPLKGGPFALHKAIDRLEAYLDEHPVDVLHVHYRRCALVARRIQQTHPVPMLYTLHLSNFSLGWFRRRLTDFGDHTHVASDEARKWLIHSAGVPQEQISMVPHGIDPLRFPQADDAARAAARAELGLSPTDVVAAYVGRMDVPKNETWMIDLAAASRDRLPNLKVIMVGEGPHENMLRRRVRRQNLGDRVLLLGHRDPLHIYYAADAFLLPSAREGFSLVCAEAMSTGIPVLRTNTAGTGELIVENATGKSVPIDHKAFIAGAMDFLSDSVGLKRMGRLAAHHVKEHFTFDRQLHDTIDLYRSLIRLTSPAPLNPPPPL
jgi:glycosyltransferase involved in cell wall biosynthesis